jgi:hypothetical protein
MSTTGQERTPSEQDRLPIFTSVGRRSTRGVAAAILLLMVAALTAVVAVIIANSVG